MSDQTLQPNEQQAEELCKSKIDACERYRLLINARNFHYENFNKWANYFYIAIGALFVAYYSIVGSEKIDDNEKLVLSYSVLMLGYILSILWYWSTKGYYYWNINFIMLVNYYEIKIFKWKKEERLYSLFANKKVQNNYASPIHGANISTSKVAILFAYIVTITWGTLLFYKMLASDPECFKIVFPFSILLSVFTVLILSISIGKIMLFSKIDHMEDLQYVQRGND